jgi:hypothetical protein
VKVLLKPAELAADHIVELGDGTSRIVLQAVTMAARKHQ